METARNLVDMVGVEMPKAFKGINSVIPAMEDVMSKIAGTAEAANGAITDTRTAIMNFIASFNSNLNSMGVDGEFASRFVDVLLLCVDYMCAIFGGGEYSYVSLASCFLRTGKLFGQIVLEWAQKVVKSFSIRLTTTRGVAQSSEDGLGGLLMGLIGSTLLGVFPKMEQVRKVNEALRSFNLIFSATTRVSAVLSKFVEFLPQAMKEWIAILFPEFALIENFDEGGKYRIWVESVLKMDNGPIRMRLTWDVKLQQEVRKLHADGLNYIAEIVSSGNNSGRLFALMHKTLQTCIELDKEIVNATLNCGRKREPFHLSLVGNPGGGKSVLSNLVADKLFPNEPKEHRVWCRNSTVSYWEGYAHQKVVVFDDFGQSKMIGPDGNCITEVMSLCGTTATPLAFAEITSKKIVFDSPVLITTSNDPYPSASDSIRDCKALWRRRHVLAQVASDDRVTDENGVIIAALLPDDFSHLRFMILDPMHSDKKKVDYVLNIAQFLDYVEKAFKRHSKQQEDLFNQVYDFAKICAVTSPTPLTWPKKHGIPTGIAYSTQRDNWQHADWKLQYAGDLTDRQVAHMSNTQIEALAKEGATEYVKTKMNRGIAQGADDELGEPELYFWDSYPFPSISWAQLQQFDADDSIFTLFAQHRRELSKEKTSILTAAFWKKIVEELKFQVYQNSTLVNGLKLVSVATIVAACFTLGCKLFSRSKETKKLVAESNIHYEAERASRLKKVRVISKHSTRFRGKAQGDDFETLLPLLLRIKQEKPDYEKLVSMINHSTLGEKTKRIYFAMADCMFPENITKTSVHDLVKVARDAHFTKEQMDDLKAILPSGVVAEASIDPNASIMLNSVVTRNALNLFMNGMRINGLGIKGSYFIGPKHFFSTIDIENSNAEIELSLYGGYTFKLTFNKHNLQFLENEDLFLYNGGVRIPAFKDIVSHFIAENDLQQCRSFEAVLATCDTRDRTRTWNSVRATALLHPMEYDQVVDGGNKIIPYTVHQGWTYNSVTNFGDCGGVLVAFDTRMKRKLVGFHVCAFLEQNRGLSTLITQERLLELLNKMPGVAQGYTIPIPLVENFCDETGCFSNFDKSLCDGIQLPIDFDLQSIESSRIIPSGNCFHLGRVSGKYSVRSPTKTQIKPSILYNAIWEHTTEPAVLHTKDPRLRLPVSPLLNGIEKYCGVMPAPPPFEIFQQVSLDITESIINRETGVIPRILTEGEAINGIIGFDFVEGLNMGTSPGWPFVCSREKGVSGKAYLFSDDFPREVIDPLLRSRIDLRLSLAKQGVRMVSVWTDCLKDERRTLEKIPIGKTRVFTIGPVDFTIVGKRMCGMFLPFMYEKCFDTFCAIGMDPFSNSWHKFTLNLLANSPYGVAGDYSNFDGSIWPELIVFVCDTINQWYADENSLIREVLFSEIIFTVALALDCMYVVFMGNPSGCPFTTLINTMINYFLIVLSWVLLAPPEMKSFYHFKQNVWISLFSDDNIMSIKEFCLPWFNLHTINAILAKYGIKYIGSDKVANVKDNPAFDKITTFTFLKCGFRRDGAIWKPLMEERVIREMISWYRLPCPDTEAALHENINNALRFMYFYGKNDFESFAAKIRKWVKGDFIKYHYLDQWYLCGKSLFQTEFETEFLERGIAQAGIFDADNKMLSHFSCCQFVAHLLRVQDGQSIDCGRDALLSFISIVPPWYRGIAQSSSAIITGEAVDSHSVLGVTLEEQRQTHEVDLTRGADRVTSRLADKTLEDTQWDLMKMTQRPTFVNTYSWPSTGVDSTPHSILAKFQVPMELLTSQLNISPFQSFTYWRCESVKVRVQLNATRFQAGKLLCFYVPLTNPTTIENWHVKHFSAASSVSHFFLDASSSSVGELSIPFVHPQGYISIDTHAGNNVNTLQYLGYFYIVVFNQLRVGATGGASDSAKFSVFVELHGSQFKVPKPAEGFSLRAIAQGGTASTTNVVKNYGHIHDVALPSNTTGDAFDVAHGAKFDIPVGAMDKPAWTVNPIAIYRRAFGYLSHSKNVDYVNRLTYDPSSQNMCEFDHFGTVQDEMLLSYLFSLPTWAESFQWNSSGGSSVPNSILASGCVAPFGFSLDESKGCVLGTVSPPVIGPSFEVTLLTYASIPFEFWRGSRKMKITIAATGFHTGRLWVGFHPGTEVVPATIVGATNQYGLMIDLQDEAREWEVVFPFLSPTPWKRVPHGKPQIPFASGLNDSILTYCTGVWSIRIINPLIVPDNVTGLIDINLFECGGPDYEVAYPAGSNTSVIYDNMFVPEPPGRGIAQSEGVGQSTLGEAALDTGAILAPTKSFVKRDEHFGESLRSVRDLVKRYFVLDQVSMSNIPKLNATGQGFFGGVVYLNCPTTYNGFPFYWATVLPKKPTGAGLLGWFGTVYRFWRGSMRYKVFQDTNWDGDSRLWVTYEPESITILDPSNVFFPPSYQAFFPHNYALENTTSWPTSGPSIVTDGKSLPMAWDGGDTNSAFSEVEVPFQTQFHVLRTGLEDPNVEPKVKTRQFSICGQLFVGQKSVYTTSSVSTLTILVAAGDDFRFSSLLGPPTVHLRSAASALGDPVTSHLLQALYPDNYTSVTVPVAFDPSDDYDVLSNPDELMRDFSSSIQFEKMLKYYQERGVVQTGYEILAQVNTKRADHFKYHSFEDIPLAIRVELANQGIGNDTKLSDLSREQAKFLAEIVNILATGKAQAGPSMHVRALQKMKMSEIENEEQVRELFQRAKQFERFSFDLPPSICPVTLFKAFILELSGDKSGVSIERFCRSLGPQYLELLAHFDDVAKLQLLEASYGLIFALKEENERLRSSTTKYEDYLVTLKRAPPQWRDGDANSQHISLFNELVQSRFGTHPVFIKEKVIGVAPDEVFEGKLEVRNKLGELVYEKCNVQGRNSKEMRACMAKFGLDWFDDRSKEAVKTRQISAELIAGVNC